MDLVTGGAGFVGSHLVDRLVAEGRRVRVLDAAIAQPADGPQRQREVVERWADDPNIDVVEGDARRAKQLDRSLRGVDRVFHLAARTGARRSFDHPEDVIDHCMTSTASLLDAMERAQVRRFVFTSSAAIYGESRPRSREGHLPSPISPYGAAKIGAEGLAHAWSAAGHGRAAVVRLAAVYGHRQRPDMVVGRWLRAVSQGRDVPLYGDVLSSRDHLYVDDAVGALVRAAEGEEPWLLVNASSGRVVTLRDLVVVVRQVTGRPVTVAILGQQPGDPHRVVLDPDRAGRRLGWQATVSLTEGVARTWAALQASTA